MRKFKPRPTDTPLGVISPCPHTPHHRHGTAVGYTVCKCKCDPCRRASALDRAVWKGKADTAPHPHASLGRKPPKPVGYSDSDDRGTWIATAPNVSHEEADAAALTIACNVTSREAYFDILEILGIRELTRHV